MVGAPAGAPGVKIRLKSLPGVLGVLVVSFVLRIGASWCFLGASEPVGTEKVVSVAIVGALSKSDDFGSNCRLLACSGFCHVV